MEGWHCGDGGLCTSLEMLRSYARADLLSGSLYVLYFRVYSIRLMVHVHIVDGIRGLEMSPARGHLTLTLLSLSLHRLGGLMMPS